MGNDVSDRALGADGRIVTVFTRVFQSMGYPLFCPRGDAVRDDRHPTKPIQLGQGDSTAELVLDRNGRAEDDRRAAEINPSLFN